MSLFKTTNKKEATVSAQNETEGPTSCAKCGATFEIPTNAAAHEAECLGPARHDERQANWVGERLVDAFAQNRHGGTL